MIPLPFNLEPIDEDNYLISNFSGFYSFIGATDLQSLIDLGYASNKKMAELEDKLFISNQEDYTTKAALLTSAVSKKIKEALSFNPIFMIVPTLRCDHTCKYCQVSRASVKANGYDLEESEIGDYILLMKRISTPPFKIEVQGGEPLIRFDLIQKIYQKAAIELGEEAFQIIITSSLSLIDDDIIEWCSSRNVSFSVSLDGDQFVHDSNRILPGDSSYKRAISSIKKLTDSLGRHRVSTVTTVTRKLVENPESLLKAHEEIGIYDLFVRPVSHYGFADSIFKDSYEFDEYKLFYTRLFNLILARRKRGIHFVEHSAAIHMKRIQTPNFNSYADLKSPAGIIFNALILNYDGNLYGSDETRMLQREIQLDLSCGDSQRFLASQNQYYAATIASSFNIVKPGCDHCVYQPYCGSDPCQNISEFGDPIGETPLSSFCQYHKMMFKFIFTELYKSEEGKEMLEEWVNA
ncbi:His-Xaa-Ser system radical SAM maturase HxsB [Halomonas piscis]|uniref:His-Xaa-Ser system radical SAM maturase HxsB n=1 Tax=Halomonas piscis TaxID=3031727 RepID=UPI0028A154BD|nr:His-Xaa-Ser system radical SAM maturase HxsB [Halomonas piscis]